MLLWILQPLGLRSTSKTNGMMIKKLHRHQAKHTPVLPLLLTVWRQYSFHPTVIISNVLEENKHSDLGENKEGERCKKKTKSVKERQGREQSRKEGSRVRRWSGAAGAERCSVAHEMELWAKEGGRLAGEKEERIMFSWAIYPICYLRVRQLHFLRLMHLETLHNAVFSSVFVLISVFCCVNYSNEDIFSAVEVAPT